MTQSWSPNESKVDSTISEFKALNFDLTDEGDVDSFLGVQIDTTKDRVVKMTQTGLIDTIIETLGFDENSTHHQTPAVSPLFTNMKTKKSSMRTGTTGR